MLPLKSKKLSIPMSTITASMPYYNSHKNQSTSSKLDSLLPSLAIKKKYPPSGSIKTYKPSAIK